MADDAAKILLREILSARAVQPQVTSESVSKNCRKGSGKESFFGMSAISTEKRMTDAQTSIMALQAFFVAVTKHVLIRADWRGAA